MNEASHPEFSAIQAFAERGDDPDGIAEHVLACPTCGTVAMTFRRGASSNVVSPALYGSKRSFRRGGMGNTFTAYDVRIGREVIIKEPAEPTDAAEAGASLRMERRLMRERRILGLLEHPAVVPVYESGQWPDGTPFFVMRRIHGLTFREAIDACESFGERIVLLPKLITIVEAIGHAHDRGVVHRDLSPDNMMLGEFGEPYVIDWGIATLTSDADEPFLDAVEPAEDGLTKGGVGKDPYASEQQRRGDVPSLLFDVYSLGVTLHHLLGGRTPERVLSGDLERLPREVPDELVSIVRRATSPVPAGRFANAGELAGELRRYQKGLLVDAHRYTLRERARRWLGRHRAAVVMLLGCLLAAGALSSAQIWRQESLEAQAQASAAEEMANEANAARNAADARASQANDRRDAAMRKWSEATERSKALTEELEQQRRLSAQEVEKLAAAIEAERAAAAEAMELRVHAENARHDAETAAETARRAEEVARAEARTAVAARNRADAARRHAEAARTRADANAALADAAREEAEERAGEAEARALAAELRARAAEKAAKDAEERVAELEASAAPTP